MVDEFAEIVKRLNDTDKKIDEISKQWVVLRHEYRSTRDKALKVEIKKKWDELQKEIPAGTDDFFKLDTEFEELTDKALETRNWYLANCLE